MIEPLFVSLMHPEELSIRLRVRLLSFLLKIHPTTYYAAIFFLSKH